ncbi:MAG: NPCBM/NEW2 domain-containing protein [Pirellulales bacterium]|nr:NPCBM/NEW2 domain-containing protein [Pirellulales bacterium]
MCYKLSRHTDRFYATSCFTIAAFFAVVLQTVVADDGVAFHCHWAQEAFSEKASTPPTNQLVLVKEGGAGDTKIGRCAAGGPLRLGDKVYKRGIGVNSHSVLRVVLDKPAVRFAADIGLDRNVDRTAASVAFHVVVAGKDVFATEVMRPTGKVRHIDVPLNGAREFELIVDEGGDGRGWDQGDWADAKVVFEDGSELWLDDLARDWTSFSKLPFSFVYGGKPSSELIGKWKRSVEEKEIDATRRLRTLVLSDPESGLEVRAVAIIYTDTQGVDWTLYFTNKGKQDTPFLEQVKALDVSIVPGDERPVTLHRITGSPCRVDDWLPLADDLPRGKRIEFAAAGGRSSNAIGPFFNLQWGKGGVVTAIGWSGQWIADASRRGDGSVRLTAGMQYMRLRLHPGETIRSPRILQVYWFGDEPLVGHNLFRQTMLKHILPKVNGKTATPPIVHLSTSFYELNDSTEANVLSHLESIKGLGFEVFWLDAYWTRDGFPKGMGNYGFPIKRAEPPDRFPRGLRPIGDAAHAAGMGYLMWFEPERVYKDTQLDKEHPEWIMQAGNGFGGHYNLGIPAAREYMTRYLLAAIKEYRLTWLRIDYNFDPLDFWKARDAKTPDRVGMSEIRYVEGHYRMWDDILAACPYLAIDNCSSGGRRIDLETCARAIPLWRTDATIGPLMGKNYLQSALQNQLITAGLSRYVPFSTSGQMGVTPYLFRSGFNAGISFCEDCRPKDYPRDMLKQAIAEGNRIRKYYFGNFYPLSEVDTDARHWCIMQYHRPEHRDGMVMAFRRHQSRFSGYQCKLHEIDPTVEYDVTYAYDYSRTKPVRMLGAKLANLDLEINDCPGSVVIEYKAVK